MKIAIVTDSTADLPPEVIDRYAIGVIPAVLVIEGREYRDQLDLPRQVFYERLPQWKTPPTTAAPSSEDFARQYHARLQNGADHVISIHLAQSLSSIYQAASLAARQFGDRVTVLDSGQLSLGLGFQVWAAAEAAPQGKAAVLRAVQAVRQQVRVFALFHTLTYLRRSGRVSWARAAIGAALSLKPLVELREGQVLRAGYTHTARQGEQLLLKRLQAIGPLKRLAILHTNAAERAHRLLAAVPYRPPGPIPVVNVTTVIGAHVGPNGLGFAALKASPAN